MGLPSSGAEAMYRNPIEEVVRFLDGRHKDKYKVFNLCNERSYDITKFGANCATFPFDDHGAPPMGLAQAQAAQRAPSSPPACAPLLDRGVCCAAGLLHVGEELAAGQPRERGGGALQGGQGAHRRDGLLPAAAPRVARGSSNRRTRCSLCRSVASWRCRYRYQRLAADAITFYNHRRTKDGRGLTVPSQRRCAPSHLPLLSDAPRRPPEPAPFSSRVGVLLVTSYPPVGTCTTMRNCWPARPAAPSCRRCRGR